MSEKQSYRDADDMPTERAVLEREWKAMRLALSMPRAPVRVDLIQCLKCQQFWTGPVDGECPHCNPIRAAVQAAQPEAVGWKLVPVEPTPAMRLAGRKAADKVDDLWAAMLAARPSAPTAVEPPYPMAPTIEGAAQDVAKWLNERPNSPLDLRHVAMLVHAVQVAPTAVEPDEREEWTDEGVDDLCWSAFESAMASGVSVDSFRWLANSLRAKQLPPRAARASKGTT